MAATQLKIVLPMPEPFPAKRAGSEAREEAQGRSGIRARPRLPVNHAESRASQTRSLAGAGTSGVRYDGSTFSL